jgi:hypothetical protein
MFSRVESTKITPLAAMTTIIISLPTAALRLLWQDLAEFRHPDLRRFALFFPQTNDGADKPEKFSRTNIGPKHGGGCFTARKPPRRGGRTDDQ